MFGRYRLPLTLRLVFHGVRAVYITGVLLVVGWLFLVPVTAEERIMLGAGTGENVERSYALVSMRFAQVIVKVAPDRAARIFSKSTDGQITPELARLILKDIADGDIARHQADAQSPTRQGSGGAKFITADRP